MLGRVIAIGLLLALFSFSALAADNYYRAHNGVSLLSPGATPLDACAYYLTGPRAGWTNNEPNPIGNGNYNCVFNGSQSTVIAYKQTCSSGTPYFYDGQCNADELNLCANLPGAGDTFVKVGTYNRTTGSYTQDADFNGPGSYVDQQGCKFQISQRSPGNECGVEVGNNNLVCKYSITNTYENFTESDPSPETHDVDAPVSTNTTIQDWMSTTSVIDTTPVLNDTPGPGETQQTETLTETVIYPPELDQETTSDITTIIMKEGYDIVKTTTTTTTTHVDNSITEVINQNFDQSSQTITTTVINNTTSAPGVTSSTAPGYSGGTTTTTVTGSDGTITSSTTSSGTSPDGIPDTPNEEQDEGEYTGPGDLDTQATDQALTDLQSIADGIGTDANGLENHSLFDLNPLGNLGGACQSITFDMPNGETMTVPGSSGCSKLTILKNILEWVVYVMLVFYAYNLATRRTA